ncbi:MAG: hypothetical protein E7328_01985 [Clostridiales bacterium]|nr:hypothetical protein [Clostridiales bacterium]
MKVLDRIFMTFLLLVLLAVCVFTVLFSLGVLPLTGVTGVLIAFDGNWVYKIIAIVVSILLFVLILKVLFHRSTHKQDDGRVGSSMRQLIKLSENVSMTSEAVCSIIQKAAKADGKVNEVECSVNLEADGAFAVRIKAAMADGVNIPQAAAEMDARVKESLLNYCGIENVKTNLVIGN